MRDVRFLHSNMRDQITEAMKTLDIPPEGLKPVSLHRYEEILISILEKFTTLGKAGLSSLWWWESFREPVSWLKLEDAPSVLERLVSPDEYVWFVAEDNGGKQRGNFWLYEGKIRPIVSVLGELFHFEYYIVSKKLEWLLCENHHNILMGVGQPAIERMAALTPAGRNLT